MEALSSLEGNPLEFRQPHPIDFPWPQSCSSRVIPSNLFLVPFQTFTTLECYNIRVCFAGIRGCNRKCTPTEWTYHRRSKQDSNLYNQMVFYISLFPYWYLLNNVRINRWRWKNIIVRVDQNVVITNYKPSLFWLTAGNYIFGNSSL